MIRMWQKRGPTTLVDGMGGGANLVREGNRRARLLVRGNPGWVCQWPDGRAATEPVLAMVHAGLTEATLEQGLRRRFPGTTVVVDNDILFTP